jgi:hypothetical protein
MSGNAWVGERPGKQDSRIARISPYLFTQHGLNNILYLPKLRDLPATGLDFKALVFDFGFNPGTPSLGPRSTAKRTLAIERPLLIWGLEGVTDDQTAPRVGYNLNILHNHEGSQRQFFNKHINDGQIVTNQVRVQLLRMPYMVIKGDEVTCEVKNLSSNAANPGGANARIQVVLYGGEFD